jgi:tRNA nucleotidyltransferase/poly(A) polymerase
VEYSSPEEDAQRRDFTINGLFYDPEKDELIDFVGGRRDLDKRLLRAIGDPGARFREDHLRLYRAVRFAAEFEFEIEARTWEQMKALSHLGKELAPERVRDELMRAFGGSHPQRAFDLLDESGLLRHWIPEVEEMKGVEQPPEFHPEGDVYTHVRMMLGELDNADPILAFSVLLHDIAKPDTYQVDPTGRIRFTAHESVGARKAETILKRLRCSNHFIEAVTACIANHMAFKDVPDMRVSTLKRFLSRPWIDHELDLHRIDCGCSHGDLSIYDLLLKKREEFSREEIKPAPLVKGGDLIEFGMPAGPKMGELLNQLYDEQLEGKFPDRPASAHTHQHKEKNRGPTGRYYVAHTTQADGLGYRIDGPLAHICERQRRADPTARPARAGNMQEKGATACKVVILRTIHRSRRSYVDVYARPREAVRFLPVGDLM